MRFLAGEILQAGAAPTLTNLHPPAALSTSASESQSGMRLRDVGRANVPPLTYANTNKSMGSQPMVSL